MEIWSADLQNVPLSSNYLKSINFSFFCHPTLVIWVLLPKMQVKRSRLINVSCESRDNIIFRFLFDTCRPRPFFPCYFDCYIDIYEYQESTMSWSRKKAKQDFFRNFWRKDQQINNLCQWKCSSKGFSICVLSFISIFSFAKWPRKLFM